MTQKNIIKFKSFKVFLYQDALKNIIYYECNIMNVIYYECNIL